MEVEQQLHIGIQGNILKFTIRRIDHINFQVVLWNTFWKKLYVFKFNIVFPLISYTP